MEELKKEELLALAENTAKVIVDASYDKLMEMLFDEIKKAIPGTMDDSIIDMLKPIIAPKVKELLLAEIAKIDGK